MKRILTYIKYELKVFLGNYASMFWMIAFPLLLLTIYTFFFSNLRFGEVELEKASVAYHEEAFMPLYFVEAPKEMPNMETLDKSYIENSLFKGKASEKDKALEALKTDEIDAYVDKDLSLVISKNGISQMIMDEVLTTAKQISSLKLPLTAYDFNRSYTENISEKYSPIDVVFYALFAMISLYGAYLSGTIGNRLIVRGKTIALRYASSPTSKARQVMLGVATSFLWSLFMVAITIAYSEFILKQHFFSPDANNIPLIMSAIIFGISWGLFLGTVIKKESSQTAAIISSLLIMSGISGMFSDGIRTLIQRTFPPILKINPVSLISDELLKVNMLGNYSTLAETVLKLTGYSIILIIISILHIRRKRA
ncbi:MAG: ABC transporter permease [Ruminococcaceae bacterium]|nr:ABC transporter permease [Oscillospiraceae bacterium]